MYIGDNRFLSNRYRSNFQRYLFNILHVLSVVWFSCCCCSSRTSKDASKSLWRSWRGWWRTEARAPRRGACSRAVSLRSSPWGTPSCCSTPSTSAMTSSRTRTTLPATCLPDCKSIVVFIDLFIIVSIKQLFTKLFYRVYKFTNEWKIVQWKENRKKFA